MSVLSIAALVATAASIVATGCVAYIVISFTRSADLIASRLGRRPRALVVVATGAADLARAPSRVTPARIPLRVRVS